MAAIIYQWNSSTTFLIVHFISKFSLKSFKGYALDYLAGRADTKTGSAEKHSKIC